MIAGTRSALLILPFAFLLFASGETCGQIKKRSQNTVFYTGAGYKFVLFTDGTASDAYPFFDFSSQAFVKELDAFFGVVLSETVALEFSPSYMFSNDYGGDESEQGGFNFESNGANRYYVPTATSLYCLPVNLRAKYFPFGKDYGSVFNLFYIGGGAGPIYISEEMEQRVYKDDSRLDYLYSTENSNNFWTVNFEAIAGIATVSKFGIGFEAGYRFIPLSSVKGEKPLVTSLAGNFNNLNFALNIIYKF